MTTGPPSSGSTATTGGPSTACSGSSTAEPLPPLIDSTRHVTATRPPPPRPALAPPQPTARHARPAPSPPHRPLAPVQDRDTAKRIPAGDNQRAAQTRRPYPHPPPAAPNPTIGPEHAG